MFSPLIQKLGHGANLTEADHNWLTGLARTQHVSARYQVNHQGDRPEDVHLVLNGFAYRYKVTRISRAESYQRLPKSELVFGSAAPKATAFSRVLVHVY